MHYNFARTLYHPYTICDNGIHMHFFVNRAPTDVLIDCESALEAEGWSVTVLN